MKRSFATCALGLLFVLAVAAANFATSQYGGPDRVVPVGFGLQATAGTLFAGACLALRDALQDAGGRFAVLLAIGAGAAISFATSTPTLALASGAAFAVSELTDAVVYTPIRKRAEFGDRQWTTAVVLSGLVGSVVDTVLFLYLAGFPILASLAGQMLGKTWPTLAFLAVGFSIRRWRSHVVRRPALQP